MKKFLALVLALFGCGVTVPTAGTHYSTPALILSPGGGRNTACYGVVTIEQVVPGTYNIYWIDADHKTHVIRGVHDVVVTYPPSGDTTCG